MVDYLLHDLQSMGLIVDIFGAIFIARSVVVRKNQEIFDTSGAFFGYSYQKTLDAIVAKREGFLGCLLLVVGFVAQFFSNLGGYSPSGDWLFYSFFISLMTFLLIVCRHGIDWWSRKSTGRLVRAYKDENEK